MQTLDQTTVAFKNVGTLTKTGGSATTIWSVPVSGAGTISLQDGTLNLNGKASSSNTFSGTVTVASQGGLNFGQGGTFSAGKVQGTVTLTFSSQITVAAGFSFTGTTQFQGGMVSFTGAVTMGNVNLSGSGGMDSAGVVTISGELNWSAGTIQGTAVFNINSLTLSASATVTLEVGSGSVLNVTGKLDIEGNLNLSFPSSGYGPAVGTVVKAINFANNYLGDFGSILNGTLSDGDVLTPDYSSTGLAFMVTK
jgi:hypothetical protein